MTTSADLRLIDYLTASSILCERYATEIATGSRIVDANLATVGAYQWRSHFHNIARDEIPPHDYGFVCDTCFAAAEFSMLHLFPLLNAAMLAAITDQFDPANYGKSRGYQSESWRKLLGELPHKIAEAIEPELHERLGLAEPTDAPCTLCVAAGHASVRCWLSGSYNNVLDRSIDYIHSVFGWHCPSHHLSGDD